MATKKKTTKRVQARKKSAKKAKIATVSEALVALGITPEVQVTSDEAVEADYEAEAKALMLDPEADSLPIVLGGEGENTADDELDRTPECALCGAPVDEIDSICEACEIKGEAHLAEAQVPVIQVPLVEVPLVVEPLVGVLPMDPPVKPTLRTVFLAKRPEPCPVCGKRHQSVWAYQNRNKRNPYPADLQEWLKTHEAALADQIAS